MPAIAVNPPFPLFTDADGQPLDDAYIYIGTANQNPVSNPITVYWDSALTITASQPIRTNGGYPVYNGSPARFYTASDYSILVRDKNGAFIYTAASETDFISSEFVTFIQSGAGAVQRTAQAKLREFVSVKDYGAVGNGIVDDTASIQAALNAAKSVFVPPGVYSVSTIVLNTGNRIYGETVVSDSISDSTGTIIKGTAGLPVFKLKETSTGQGEEANISIEKLVIKDGNYGISALNGGVWVRVSQVKFGVSVAAVYWQGFIQEWRFDDVECNGGQYGIYHNNVSGSVYAQVLVDKCYFSNVYCTGQSINGIRIKATAGNNVSFDNLRVVYCTQDGIYLDGGLRYFTFKNLNTESNGYLGLLPPSPITGSIAASSNSCTVSSSGYASNGDTVTIAGAGTNGEDLVTTISSGAGTTTWTLAATASTTVNNAEVTKYVYSDVKFASLVGNPGYITFIDATVGLPSSVAALRYGVDASGIIAGLQFINGVSNRPIYDPNSICLGIGNGLSIRRPFNFEAQALKSYLSRSFTPGITFGGASTGVTYTSRSGYATKIGNLVNFNIDIQLSNKGSSTGAAVITGLPFAVTNSGVNWFSSIAVTALSSGVTAILGRSNNNATTISLVGDNTSPFVNNGSSLTDAIFSNTTRIQITGSYISA